MAIPTNLYDSYAIQGMKLDISDLIHNISPTECPALSMAGTTSATQRFHQWQLDALASPNGSNNQIEGDTAALTAATATDLVGNYTAIAKKTFGVSGTIEVTDKYGRDSELAYQAAKSARELKTDVDMAITGVNAASSAGVTDSAGRVSGSLGAWLVTNEDAGAGGSGTAFSGGIQAARTEGTPRAFTQLILDNVIEQCWESGAKPSVLLVGPGQKKVFSTFDGVGARRTDAESKTVVGTADLYMSLFGDVRVVPSRHIKKSLGTGTTEGSTIVDRNAFVLDPEYLKVAYLRPWQQYDLAKTGDNIQREMLVEWTLEVCTEKAHGIAADLGTP